jgi:UDP-glucose 4-epimerase
MRILITGGAGFIGRHIAEHFNGRAEVRVLDNLHSGFRANLSGLECELIVGSILDRELVREAMKGIDFVFHLAAMVNAPGSVERPREYNEINAGGTAIVLEEAARARVRKLIFSSSAAIYGDNPTPRTESAPAKPKSPYATSKYEAEQHCCSFTNERKLATVSLRYFNVFGPYQHPRSEYSAVVPTFFERAVRNEPITIFGDGLQTRDFIYVKDVVTANVFFALKSQGTGIFNVACGRQITIIDLARTIRQLTKSNSPITYSPERPGDVKHSVADTDKTQRAGFRAVCDLAEGLRATIGFFKKNPEAIESRRQP